MRDYHTNRAICLLILRAVVAAVAIVAANAIASYAGCSFSARAVLFAWTVAACILAGRCMAEIDQAGKIAAVRPLPEWIHQASEAVEPRHVANDELERTLAELYELRTKLQQCAMWAADTEKCRAHCERKAREYRNALDGLGELWESAHSKIMAAKIERRNAEDREAVTIAELLAERELLRKAILKNTKQAAVIHKLRARLADRRERRRKAIDRALVKETAAASLIPVVHSYGGIDPDSDAFKACYSSRADAIENGIPSYILGRSKRKVLRVENGERKWVKDRDGRALDCLAAELETCGFFHTPEDRHAPEYLLELIRNRTPSAVFDCSATYAMQSEQQQLDSEEQYDDSFNPAELEAIPL